MVTGQSQSQYCCVLSPSQLPHLTSEQEERRGNPPLEMTGLDKMKAFLVYRTGEIDVSLTAENSKSLLAAGEGKALIYFVNI